MRANPPPPPTSTQTVFAPINIERITIQLRPDMRVGLTVVQLELKLERVDQCKVKGKVQPRTGHEGPEVEQRYNSTLSLTSALDGGG